MPVVDENLQSIMHRFSNQTMNLLVVCVSILALHKAGKHMEGCILAAYVGLLLGCTIQGNSVSKLLQTYKNVQFVFEHSRVINSKNPVSEKIHLHFTIKYLIYLVCMYSHKYSQSGKRLTLLTCGRSSVISARLILTYFIVGKLVTSLVFYEQSW